MRTIYLLSYPPAVLFHLYAGYSIPLSLLGGVFLAIIPVMIADAYLQYRRFSR